MVGKKLKAWFGKGGDRTIAQQLTGLQELTKRVPGKSVLDVGCAEGLIGIHLYDAGATAIHGLEIRPDYVAEANRLRGDRACTFEVADANVWVPKRNYQIVLMLAVLQKLKDPDQACVRFVRAARDLVVIRLPPKEAPCIVDERSGNRRVNIDDIMDIEGFRQITVTKGPLAEWTAYYERVYPI